MGRRKLNNEELKELGEKIRVVRVLRNISQEEFGRNVGGYAGNQVCMWEKGKQQPSALALINIIKKYGLEV